MRERLESILQEGTFTRKTIYDKLRDQHSPREEGHSQIGSPVNRKLGFQDLGFGSMPSGRDDFVKLKEEVEELRAEKDSVLLNFNQKIGSLRASARNFIISASKLASFVQPTNPSVVYVLKTFENDKNILHGYIQNLVNLILP